MTLIYELTTLPVTAEELHKIGKIGINRILTTVLVETHTFATFKEVKDINEYVNSVVGVQLDDVRYSPNGHVPVRDEQGNVTMVQAVMVVGTIPAVYLEKALLQGCAQPEPKAGTPPKSSARKFLQTLPNKKGRLR